MAFHTFLNIIKDIESYKFFQISLIYYDKINLNKL